MDIKDVSVSVTYTVKEVRNDRGDLVGAVVPVAVPGLSEDGPLVPFVYMGWAHDWDGDNPTGEYFPLCLGANDDDESLLRQIVERARYGQGAS